MDHSLMGEELFSFCTLSLGLARFFAISLQIFAQFAKLQSVCKDKRFLHRFCEIANSSRLLAHFFFFLNSSLQTVPIWFR
jgi:hypothetical protein